VGDIYWTLAHSHWIASCFTPHFILTTKPTYQATFSLLLMTLKMADAMYAEAMKQLKDMTQLYLERQNYASGFTFVLDITR
jgi:hypothetical protein